MEARYAGNETEEYFRLKEPKTKRISHNSGAALIAVTAMIIVASFMVAGVYYFLHRGVEVSGLEKRYQTAREASLGGIDVFTKEIIPQAISGTTLTDVMGGFASLTSASVSQGATSACFNTKLLQSTADWGSCSSSLPAKTDPDVVFQLKGAGSAGPFNVYTKIVDTVQGNSDTSGVTLEGQGTAETQTGMVTVQHFPYLYRVETQGEKQAAPEEKANFTVLYAY